MTFRVGQKVECINVDPMKVECDGRVTTYIKLGGVYTVRWVGECPYEPWRELGLNIRLVGIVRPDNSAVPEWSDFPFRAARFRPIVERKTDISIFTKMLTGEKVRA